jgi:hypothetical protein
MSEFSAVAYANTGYTGFLSSSGFDLSLVFMNINAVVSGTGASSYPITNPTMVGYSNKISGVGDNISVAATTTYTVASATIEPGVYIVTMYVYNTVPNALGYLQHVTLELSTSNTLGASAVKLTGSSTITAGGANSIIANITIPITVNTSAMYYLLMSINYGTTFTSTTCKKTECFFSYVKIA